MITVLSGISSNIYFVTISSLKLSKLEVGSSNKTIPESLSNDLYYK